MNTDEDIRIEKNANGIESYVFDPYNSVNTVITDAEIQNMLSKYGINIEKYTEAVVTSSLAYSTIDDLANLLGLQVPPRQAIPTSPAMSFL